MFPVCVKKINGVNDAYNCFLSTIQQKEHSKKKISKCTWQLKLSSNKLS